MLVSILLILTASANLLMVAVLGSLARSGIPGTREALWSSVLVFISLLGFATQSALPPSLGIVGSNLFMALGVAMVYVAVRRYFGLPVPLGWVAAGVAAQSAGMILFWYVWRDIDARIVVVSVLHSALSAATAWTVLHHRPYQRPGYPYLFTVGVSTFAAVGHAVRGLIYLLRLDPTQSVANGTVLHIIFLAIGVMVVPSLTLGFIMMVHDRMLADRETEANTDSLTGVLSRRAWWMLAEKMVAGAMRNERRLSLLMLDIDRFKQINDTYGHLSGDAVLRHFGALAAQVLRIEDVTGRVGGEEFAVLFPDTGQATALSASRRLLEAVRMSPCEHGNVLIAYTFSGGVVEWDGRESAQMLAQRADRVLYAAKAAGRDRVLAQ